MAGPETRREGLGAAWCAIWRAIWPSLLLAFAVLLIGNLGMARQHWHPDVDRPLPAYAALLLSDPLGGGAILVPYADLDAFRARFPQASLRPPAAAGQFRIDGLSGFYETRTNAEALTVTVHRTRYGGDPDGWLVGFDRFRYSVVGQEVKAEQMLSTGGLTGWLPTLLVVGLGWVLLLDGGAAVIGLWRRWRGLPRQASPAPVASLASVLAAGALVFAAQQGAQAWLDPLASKGPDPAVVLGTLALALAALALLAHRARHPAPAPQALVVVPPSPGKQVAATTRMIARLLLAMVVVGVLVHLSGVARWRGASQNGFDIRSRLSAVMMAIDEYRAVHGVLPPTLADLPASAQTAVGQLREQFEAVEWSPAGHFDLRLLSRSVETAASWRLARVERDGIVYWDWCAAEGLPADWPPLVCGDPRWLLIDLFDSSLPTQLQANAPPLSGQMAPLAIEGLIVLQPTSPARALIAGLSSDAPHRIRLRLSQHPAVPATARGRELVIEGFRTTGHHEWSARREPTGLRCYLAGAAPVTVAWDRRCEGATPTH